jgi:hypothetical protein
MVPSCCYRVRWWCWHRNDQVSAQQLSRIKPSSGTRMTNFGELEVRRCSQEDSAFVRTSFRPAATAVSVFHEGTYATFDHLTWDEPKKTTERNSVTQLRLESF